MHLTREESSRNPYPSHLHSSSGLYRALLPPAVQARIESRSVLTPSHADRPALCPANCTSAARLVAPIALAPLVPLAGRAVAPLECQF